MRAVFQEEKKVWAQVDMGDVWVQALCAGWKVGRNGTPEVLSDQFTKNHVGHDEDLYSISNETHQRILEEFIRLAFYLERSL